MSIFSFFEQCQRKQASPGIWVENGKNFAGTQAAAGNKRDACAYLALFPSLVQHLKNNYS
jgi:hypothetical protein